MKGMNSATSVELYAVDTRHDASFIMYQALISEPNLYMDPYMHVWPTCKCCYKGCKFLSKQPIGSVLEKAAIRRVDREIRIKAVLYGLFAARDDMFRVNWKFDIGCQAYR